MRHDRELRWERLSRGERLANAVRRVGGHVIATFAYASASPLDTPGIIQTAFNEHKLREQEFERLTTCLASTPERQRFEKEGLLPPDVPKQM